ncbi:alpha/beta hydrolase [Salidesulfovibrio brasiliensis]
MIAVLKMLLLVAGGTYLAMVLFVFFSQRGMVYMPSRELGATPSDADLPYEEVYLETRQGTRIHGWFIPHPQAELSVLFCHGNAGNISHRLETARILNELGVSAFFFDYSGYGNSAGKPSEPATEADARAAWDWLAQRVEPERIVLHGRSIGGGVAVSLAHELAAEGVHPAGLILESTFSSMVDAGAHHYPWLPVRLLSRYRYESARKAATLDAPALMIHSRTDEIVPFDLGRKLFAAYAGHKEFLEIKGSHNSGYLDSGAVYTDGLRGFFESVLPGKK